MSTIPAPLPKPGRVCISGLTDCGYRQHQVFECVNCKREVCWCQGAMSENDKPHQNDWCVDCQTKGLP